MARILSVFKYLKRVGFAVLVGLAFLGLLTCTHGFAEDKLFATESDYLAPKISSQYGRSECFREFGNVFRAGSRATLKLLGRGSVFTAFELGNHPVHSNGWPEGLIIEAGLIRNGELHVDQEIAKLMLIERWIDGMDRYADSVLGT